MQTVLKECPKCGKRSSGYECPECGTNLNNIKQVKVDVDYSKYNETNCPHCGRSNSSDAKWCTYCKGYISERKPPLKTEHSMAYYSATTESYVGLYILSAIVPLVGFIVGGIRLANNEDGGLGCVIAGIISSIICSLIIFL